MTTHSPSTVALAPEESLFEMQRKEPRIGRPKNKASLIGLLTEGMLVVEEATQIVFVEGSNDPEFFSRVWEILTEHEPDSSSAALEESPNLIFVHGQGRETVYGVVQQLRSNGLTRFHGIIDRDDGNPQTEGVQVLLRNGLENYLFDPLNVWVLLHQHEKAPDVAGVSVPRGLTSRVRTLRVDQLQSIVNEVCANVERETPTLDARKRQERDVTFLGGVRLRYPAWVLTLDDKELQSAFRNTFRFPFFNRQKLYQSYGVLRLVPAEIVDALKAIQDSVLTRGGAARPSD